jgi:hypothetical protein
VHDNFRGDAQGAVSRLMADQTGEATAALSHPDIGDIDLVYGKPPEGRNPGFGLAKIAQKHPEVMDDLQGFLSRLRRDDAGSGSNRVRLSDDNGVAMVSLNWKGAEKKWLLTAYEKKAGRDASIDTASVKPADDTASRGTGNEIVGGPGGEGKQLSPVESNVREAAQLAPETPVHLDSSDPNAAEHNGTLASALEIIDNEHAATVDDAKLFSVAANCFIATGF